jgi:hypothetical protein
MQTPVNAPGKLLLPPLKTDHKVGSGNRGLWNPQDPKAFNDVADSLDYKASGEVKNVSSVPTIWARPLSMEMALHNNQYPLRAYMIPMWYGMLAAIALAEIRGFPLKAELLELGTRKNSQVFANSLYELLPDAEYALYTFPNNSGDPKKVKNPWEDIYIFSWDGNTVGMSSPSTLVVPSEQGQWHGLPWWNGNTNRLEAPHPHLNEKEKALLVAWLNNINSEIRNHNGQNKAIDMISGLLRIYMGSLGGIPDPEMQFSDDEAFFGVNINRGALIALDKPIRQEISAVSQVKVIGSSTKKPTIPLLIVDKNIARAWGTAEQNIAVHQGKTLASFTPENLAQWRKSGKVECLTPEELFLPKLYFIDSENIFRGSERVTPNGANNLKFQGNLITPLIPVNPLLLNYFTPEDLSRKVIKMEHKGAGVQVTLDIPLYGLKGETQPQNFRLVKHYSLDECNSYKEVPILEVWPNFQAEGWQEYYAFYYDLDCGSATFAINFPHAQETETLTEKRGKYQTIKLAEFPNCIECKDDYTNTIGLILLPTPDEIRLAGKWTVGIDFGTSFTNVYVNKNGTIVERLTLDNLHLQVTDVNPNIRLDVLFDFFIPENFLPPEKPFPMSTILTIRGNLDSKQTRPILDGRLYIPDQSRFDPQNPWIKTDLKWSKENAIYNQIFLKHLALHITAMAVKHEVKTIQWSISYPSALSNNEVHNYIDIWQEITQELNKSTGIQHQCADSISESRYFRTESLSLAQYFADREQENLIRTACLDIGGGTCDISIWLNNSLLHQCSIQLAGRDLFSQFIELNPKFLSRFNIDVSQWNDLRGSAFSAKLDVWMKQQAEIWLKKERYNLADEKDFQGLIRLMAIGFAGIYFYIGTILSVLDAEGTYTEDKTTSVYVGGNGSRLLHWLAPRGTFTKDSEVNNLFNKMLSFASQLEDSENPTKLSISPKDEVACGLVLGDTRLKGLDRKSKDPLVLGEDCKIDDEYIGYNERLKFKGKSLSKMEIPNLNRLRLFLDAFHAALDELDIEEIKPLDGYEWKKDDDSPEPKYNKQLWQKTEDELRQLLLKMKGVDDVDKIRQEPTFIIALKALLLALGKEWAGK